MFSIHVLQSCRFCQARAETIAKSDVERKRRRRGDEERQGESFGTDFTNKCRRLNPGMLQDGSFSLNHRLPAFSVFYLALRRIIPSYVVLSSVSSFPLVISSLRPSRRRLHLRDRFPSSRQLGNLPHAYAAVTLSLFRYYLKSCVNYNRIGWNRKMWRYQQITKDIRIDQSRYV